MKENFNKKPETIYGGKKYLITGGSVFCHIKKGNKWHYPAFNGTAWHSYFTIVSRETIPAPRWFSPSAGYFGINLDKRRNKAINSIRRSKGL